MHTQNRSNPKPLQYLLCSSFGILIPVSCLNAIPLFVVVVKYEVSQREVLIKIIEIMITVDLYVISPIFTKCVLTYYKYCIYAFLIQYLHNPDSPARIQTYLLISYYCTHNYCTRHTIFT